MRVMKFGGTSVTDADRIKEVVKIVLDAASKDRVVIVCSAMKGNTDLLIDSAKKAESGDKSFLDNLQKIRDRKLKAVTDLYGSVEKGSLILKKLNNCINELQAILHGVELIKECSPRSLDLISGFGERLNCMLIADYFTFTGNPAEYVDAREIIVTDDNYNNASVYFEKSYERISKRILSIKGIAVVTGFVAATEEGVSTTLGRNGSDYTGSIIGAGVDADIIEIWTDVDGVLSADPRLVKTAFVIPEISFQEAMELSFFGAKVIHPYTMIPAVDKNIPLLIKNTMNPSAPGTLIAKEVKQHPYAITGIASIEDAAILNIEGGGMVGLPGIASRIFTIFAKFGINVIMISQASSEHSICIAVKQKEGEMALAKLEEELAFEQEHRKIQQVEFVKDLEIIAIIGENMRGRPGISGKLFSALGENNINVLAIAQGSSERNISFVVEKVQRDKALNVIHKAFLGI